MNSRIDRRFHLRPSRLLRAAGHFHDAPRKFIPPGVQVLADEVQDLRAVVAVPHRPARFGGVRGVRRLHRLADILAVAVAYLPDQLAFRAEHGLGVVPIRAHLLAADIHLGRAVYCQVPSFRS